MTEAVSEMRAQFTFAQGIKRMATDKLARIGSLVAIGGTTIVTTASAAIDFTNISELLQAVVTLIPDFLALVVAIAPLLVTVAIVAFVIGFLKSILDWIGKSW